MRKFRKPLSLVLALMLALSMFGVCASASAAEVSEPAASSGHSGTISVTSNISDPVSVNYDYYNDEVTVTYSLQSPHSIVNTQAYVEYDSNVLELADVDLDVNIPQLNKGSAVFNSDVANHVYINATKINFYNFKTEKIYYTQTFRIIGTGDTTVNMVMEVLTGSDQTDYNQATNENDIALVDFDEVLQNEFTFTASAELSGEEPATEAPTEEPTTEAPTTEPETEPVTVPGETITVFFTDALNWGSVNIYYWNDGPDWPGSAMTYTETNSEGMKVYSAVIPADVDGIIFNGNGNQTVEIETGITDGAQWYTIDEKVGYNYKVGYGESPVQPTTAEPTETPTEAPTEKPTEAPTEAPTVPASDDAVDRDGTLIVGDDFTLMLNTASSTNVVGEIYLPAGEYKFRVQKDRTLMGYNATVNDKTTKGLTFNPKFKAQTTLVATGGTYKFQFSNTANALVIYHVDSEVPDAHLTGDLHTILKPVLGKEGLIASGSMYIAPGQYKFKVVNGETECGYGAVIDDKTADGKMLSINPKYQSSLTLNATGGMYTFTLYTQTNKLKIAYVNDSAESKTDVHVAGDFSLVLDDNDGESDIATGTVTLAAGTYGFKIYNYGVIYTIGETINDSATKSLKNFYSKPLTLNATGGTYSFTFNKVTGKLTVEKQ